MFVEGLMRWIIHEPCERTEPREKPSEVFRRYFGPAQGVGLPPRRRYGYRPIVVADKDEG